MTHRIVKYLNDPILERPANPVTEFDTPELHGSSKTCSRPCTLPMASVLPPRRWAHSKRLTVIDITEVARRVGPWPDRIVLINPEVIAREGRQTGEEGCLSIPGFREPVTRAKKTTVRAQNAKGEWFEITGEDLLARAFLHEIDHLNGILFLSHLSSLKREVIKRRIKKLQKAGEWE